MDPRLRKATREAREDFGTAIPRAIDWKEVDAPLFARLEQERRLEASRALGQRLGRGSSVWAASGAVLAAAACFALYAGKTRVATSLDAPVAALPAPVAGNVVGILGSGELLIDGKPAAISAVLHLGDVVETKGTSVTIDRPGKLAMVLEAGTLVRVTHVQGALVLALDTGAVEAQVVPVPAGEAFAVDVAGSRVAVHGTHLRVAREGTHVVVDLNEGAVVVGAAPREGSTVGALVTAPAHADFEAAGLPGSLAVSHDPASVRPPVAVTSPSSSSQPSSASLLLPQLARSPDAHPPAIPWAVPTQTVTRPTAAAPSAPASSEPAPDPNASATLAAAVKACMASRQGPENVGVEVSTTLHLELDDSGHARAARFDPPVAPDVNACAAATIYRTRWSHGGSAEVAVDYKASPAGNAP